MGLADRVYEIIGTQTRKPSGWLGKVTGHSMAWEHKPLIKWTITLMDVQPTDHVLDVGCGSGVAIKLIAQIAVEGFVASVDYSEVMVQQALKRNAAAVRAGRVEIKHGDVAALPYDDESFDKVIAVEMFYFWPDPIVNLREVRRVTRSPEPAEGRPGWSFHSTPARRQWRCSLRPGSVGHGLSLRQTRATAGCAPWASNNLLRK